MTAPCHPLAALAALCFLPGCAAIHSFDRMADQVEFRSNCHTSTGEWVGGASCTIEWSVSKTISTTTVVTTTAVAPASTAAPPPTDD